MSYSWKLIKNILEFNDAQLKGKKHELNEDQSLHVIAHNDKSQVYFGFN